LRGELGFHFDNQRTLRKEFNTFDFVLLSFFLRFAARDPKILRDSVWWIAKKKQLYGFDCDWSIYIQIPARYAHKIERNSMLSWKTADGEWRPIAVTVPCFFHCQ
jgi:hypothetical protein